MTFPSRVRLIVVGMLSVPHHRASIVCATSAAAATAAVANSRGYPSATATTALEAAAPAETAATAAAAPARVAPTAIYASTGGSVSWSRNNVCKETFFLVDVLLSLSPCIRRKARPSRGVRSLSAATYEAFKVRTHCAI